MGDSKEVGEMLLEAAKLHQEAVEIIAQALSEITTGCPAGCRQAATAIIARLAHAKILLEKVD